jgi:two-component system NtrC family sensor kinase
MDTCMRLRQKLFIILSLMTCIPLLILLFGVVERIEQDMETRIEADLHDTLKTMAGEVDSIIKGQVSTARGLAKVPVVRTFLQAAHSNNTANYDEDALLLKDFFMKYQSSVPSIQAVRVIDDRGKTVLKVKEGKNIEPQLVDNERGRYYIADQSQRPFFRNALDSIDDVYISDFELGQVRKDAEFCPAMLRYSIPLRDTKDDFAGMLVVNMWGARIDNAVLASMTGHTGKVYIVEVNDEKPSRDGVYLYNDDNTRRFANQLGTSYRFETDVGKSIWKKLRKQITPGTFKLHDGRILFHRQYSPYDDERSRWLMVIETSQDTIFKPIERIRSTIWFLLAILLVMSLLLARWVSGRLAQPVQNLARIIDGYADGDHKLRYTEKRQDDIGVAGKAFNNLCDTLENAEIERDKAEKAAEQSERLAAVGQMAAGIGHEINNPLMNIMSLATLAEQSISEDNNEQAKADLSLLKEEGKRCAQIVQGILNFARRNKPVFALFDMSELLHDTLNLIHHKFLERNIILDLDIEDDICMIGDKGQLQQVLVNVLLNAIYASPDGGAINVSAYINKNNKIIIKVLDYGEGVKEQEVNRIFNPFYSTKPEGQGTGMGLSVSYGIIDKHNGKISVENTEQAGALVTILLPAKTRDQNESNATIENTARQ